MSNYWDILRSTTDCVQFAYAADVDEEFLPLPAEMRANGVVHAYVDYLEVRRSGAHICNVIAKALRLENAPYEAVPGPRGIHIWIPFLDDLGGLSYQVEGAAIIIDNADVLLAEDSKTMFKLIEAFLAPLHHWLDQKKPFHLCFQMEKSDLVRRIFG